MTVINTNKIEDFFEDFIIDFHKMIMKSLREEFHKYNFNMSQAEVLRYIVKEKNPTMKDVADHLGIKPPSLTTIVEVLIEKKFVKKVQDKKDNRITRLTITQKAKNIIEKIKNNKIKFIKNTFSSLSLNDKKELIRILSELNK